EAQGLSRGHRAGRVRRGSGSGSGGGTRRGGPPPCRCARDHGGADAHLTPGRVSRERAGCAETPRGFGPADVVACRRRRRTISGGQTLTPSWQAREPQPRTRVTTASTIDARNGTIAV